MKKISTLLIVILLFFKGYSQNTDDFIMTYEVDNETGLEVVFPFEGDDFTIDLGDGNTLTDNTYYTYENPGIYTITVSGNINRINYGELYYYPSDEEDSYKSKVKSVEQWGTTQWITMENAFEGLVNLEINATDIPDLSLVTNMKKMFNGASSFNQNINNWDVSNVENMERMFYGATLFNQPLNNWNVSNVTTMRSMFANAKYFNQNLNDWDVSSVTDMSGMFFQFTYSSYDGVFNQPLNDWDVSSVTNMSEMFTGSNSFNQPLNDWDVSSVTNM